MESGDYGRLCPSMASSTDLTPPCTPSFHLKERKMITAIPGVELLSQQRGEMAVMLAFAAQR